MHTRPARALALKSWASPLDCPRGSSWGASRSRFRGPPVNTPRGVYRQREKGVTDNAPTPTMVPEKGSPDPDNGARKMVTDNATDNARGGSPTTPRHRQWFLGGVFPEFPGRLKTFACKNVVTATKPTHLLTFLFERKIDSPSCKTPPNAPIPNLPGRKKNARQTNAQTDKHRPLNRRRGRGRGRPTTHDHDAQTHKHCRHT